MPSLLEEKPTTSEESHSKQAANIFGSAATASSSHLPKGVVIGKDGKPCRTCTSSAAWMAMMKGSSSAPSTKSKSQTQPVQPPPLQQSTTATTDDTSPSDCPPDVETLGRASWTLLHTLTASYPTQPSPSHQAKTKNFLHLFSQLYPCWVCAEDFQSWMKGEGGDVEEALKSQEGFGRWMCRAHNAVNGKLGKEEFDCDLWKERWRDGWRDGRCG